MKKSKLSKIISKKRKTISRIPFFSIAILFSILAAEAILRTWYYQFPNSKIEFWRYKTSLQQISSDPRGFVHTPSARLSILGTPIQTNSRGFRSEEFSVKKPKSTYRVFILGNANVLGWGIPEDKTLARLLDQRLNRPGARGRTYKKIEIINAAVADYRLEQQLFSFLIDLSKYEPDSVILCMNLEDARTVTKYRFNPLSRSSYLLAAMRAWSSGFVDLFKSENTRIAEYRSLYAGSSWLKFRSNAAELVHELRNRKIRLIPVIMPDFQTLASYPFNEVHWKIANLFAELGHYPLDLLPRLHRFKAQELKMNGAESYPNEKAHQIMAQGIAEWIEKRGLIR